MQASDACWVRLAYRVLYSIVSVKVMNKTRDLAWNRTFRHESYSHAACVAVAARAGPCTM